MTQYGVSSKLVCRVVKKRNTDVSALAREGGLARARNLTPEERRESARKAVNARWERHRIAQESAHGIATSHLAAIDCGEQIRQDDSVNPTEARTFETQWRRSLEHHVSSICPCDECIDAVVQKFREDYGLLLAKIDSQSLLEKSDVNLFKSLMGNKPNRWTRVYRAIRKVMMQSTRTSK